MAIDYPGIAILLTSATTSVVSIVTLVRQGKNKADTDVKLQELHAQGNSNLETARILAEKLSVIAFRL